MELDWHIAEHLHFYDYLRPQSRRRHIEEFPFLIERKNINFLAIKRLFKTIQEALLKCN
jgi:hypothetical protein